MLRPRLVPRRRRLQLTALIVIAALGAGIGPVTAAGGGTKTSQPAMLTPVGAGITVTPLITVGETAGDDGYVFESVPDGIAVKVRNNAIADVYVNHETSRVPFPYTPSAPTELNSQNDFDNAQVSKLALHRKSAGVLSGTMVITSDDNYQRFCSSYLATAAEGFDREILFTNEESVDWVNRIRQRLAGRHRCGRGAPVGRGRRVRHQVRRANARSGAWAATTTRTPCPSPGFDDIVMLSGDDTFTNNPSQSQLYSYIAPDADAVWNDEGDALGVPDERLQAEVRGLRARRRDLGHRAVHPGPEAHRDGTQCRWDGLDGRGCTRVAGRPVSRSRRTARHGSATRTASASMARSGSSMTGRAPRTTSSASSASRTSRTTSDRACPMSRTSSTPAGAPRLCSAPPAPPFRNSDPDLDERASLEDGPRSRTTRPR